MRSACKHVQTMDKHVTNMLPRENQKLSRVFLFCFFVFLCLVFVFEGRMLEAETCLGVSTQTMCAKQCVRESILSSLIERKKKRGKKKHEEFFLFEVKLDVSETWV